MADDILIHAQFTEVSRRIFLTQSYRGFKKKKFPFLRENKK